MIAPRSRALLAALLLTLAVSAWVALRGEDEVVAAAATVPRAAVVPLARGEPAVWPVLAPRSAAAAGWPPLAGAARAAWGAPPVLAVAVLPTGTASAPAAPPPAPRFPFTVIGRWDDGTARPLLLLGGAQRTHAVGTGDVVDGQWRIERIGAESFSVTFLPLGSVQTVATRSS